MMILLLWTFIGVLGGIVLGLTGAGGGIITVPLVVYLLDVDVAVATVFALLMILTGAPFNWFAQRRNTDLPAAVLMAAFSVVGSWSFTPLKARSPEWLIILLFSGVCLYSLFLVWRRRNRAMPSGPALAAARRKRTLGEFLALGVAGIALGALTTMTGLGGGTLIIPFLLGPGGLSFTQAVPTSLLAMSLTACGSLASQWRLVSDQLTWGSLSALATGALAASFVVRALLSRLTVEQSDQVRRWVFTVVILISVGSLLTR